MARIVLWMGSSHTPMLNAPPTDWPRFIERDSRRTNLLDVEGRLTSYDEQLKHAPPGIAAEIAPERMAARSRRARSSCPGHTSVSSHAVSSSELRSIGFRSRPTRQAIREPSREEELGL